MHALRHTFAKAMEDSGAKVSKIQARLGHSILATMGRYLAALINRNLPVVRPENWYRVWYHVMGLIEG